MAESVSRIGIAVTVTGKGVAKGQLKRHLAPTTVGEITRRLPLSGRVARYKDIFVYVLVGLQVGREKARSRFKRGELALMPANGSLCLFLKDADIASPLNPVGEIVEGLEVVEAAGPGDVITFTRVDVD